MSGWRATTCPMRSWCRSGVPGTRSTSSLTVSEDRVFVSLTRPSAGLLDLSETLRLFFQRACSFAPCCVFRRCARGTAGNLMLEGLEPFNALRACVFECAKNPFLSSVPGMLVPINIHPTVALSRHGTVGRTTVAQIALAASSNSGKGFFFRVCFSCQLHGTLRCTGATRRCPDERTNESTPN